MILGCFIKLIRPRNGGLKICREKAQKAQNFLAEWGMDSDSFPSRP